MAWVVMCFVAHIIFCGIAIRATIGVMHIRMTHVVLRTVFHFMFGHMLIMMRVAMIMRVACC